VTLRERSTPAGTTVYEVVDGNRPSRKHLRALWWLLDEHPRAPRPATTAAYEGVVRLAIASTPMARGRLGHAYALNDGPLGDPAGDVARGILARWVQAALGQP
jgi:hypothetical protein